MGGMIAQVMVFREPDRVHRLVLMDTHHGVLSELDPDTHRDRRRARRARGVEGHPGDPPDGRGPARESGVPARVRQRPLPGVLREQDAAHLAGHVRHDDPAAVDGGRPPRCPRRGDAANARAGGWARCSVRRSLAPHGRGDPGRSAGHLSRCRSLPPVRGDRGLAFIAARIPRRRVGARGIRRSRPPPDIPVPFPRALRLPATLGELERRMPSVGDAEGDGRTDAAHGSGRLTRGPRREERGHDRDEDQWHPGNGERIR